MKIVKPSHKILSMPSRNSILKFIESAGRTCYKSEEKITSNSAASFVKQIIDSGHHSVIEHSNITVRFVCDRGVSHELVRHRLASYSQESTRYADYSRDKFGREITLIRPFFWAENSAEFLVWAEAMSKAEKAYMKLTASGARPEEARTVLPNSLKTEIVMTCNIREWRHVLTLRCSTAAHPQMREITLPLLAELNQKLPELFGNIFRQFKNDIENFVK